MSKQNIFEKMQFSREDAKTRRQAPIRLHKRPQKAEGLGVDSGSSELGSSNALVRLSTNFACFAPSHEPASALLVRPWVAHSP